MTCFEELSPKEREEATKAWMLWIAAGSPMPSVAYYGPSLLDKIKGVQPMKENGDGER